MYSPPLQRRVAGNHNDRPDTIILVAEWKPASASVRGGTRNPAGWSVLIFAAIFWILQTVALAVLGRFIAMDFSGPLPPSLGFLWQSCQVLVVAAATFVMARIEKRPLLSYGYVDPHKGGRLPCWVGLGPILFLRYAGQWPVIEWPPVRFARFG